ncbi:MAG: ABC transporter ATP-binding protein/permease [Rhodospirillaceae bacterium]|nr:ABC transporter ATP-binding protein/permease [Rhodospirillaceae bacterium]
MDAPVPGGDAATPPPRPRGNELLDHVKTLLRVLSHGRRRGRLLALSGGVVVVICANAAGQIRLNDWQGAFYDALGQRDLPAFLTQLGVFVLIIAVLLSLTVAQTWLQEMVKISLRETLTGDLLDQWLRPKRAYRLAFAGEIGINPDQRVQEDARHLCELTAELSIGLLQSSLLLVSFVGVLWVLSSQVVFMTAETSFTIPGYMVWCALVYALIGSALTRIVGRPLIRLNAERYAREADFRFALVRLNESAEGVALYGGEGDERRLLGAALDRVLRVMLQLAAGLARLTWVTSGYGWLALVAPVIVASPGYFMGTMTLGGLMMVVGAFYQVQQALRWYVDNFPRIADWRATLLRVMSFRDALQAVEGLGAEAGRITLGEHPAGRLAMRDFGVLLAEGRASLDEPEVEIGPGERVLILGGPGSGKSTMFLALAGLWPWGTGTVLMPPAAEMAFLQQRPYMPLDTLRAALAYPQDPKALTDEAAQTALRRVGLGQLASRLDSVERWDKELTFDEQQRLAAARLLLRRPRWIVMDEGLTGLSDESLALVCDILRTELAEAAIIDFARSAPVDGFFTRTLHLRQLPGGHVLTLRPEAAAPAASA